jgi:hypothetical protein
MGDGVTPERSAFDKDALALALLCAWGRSGGLDKKFYFFGALPCGAVLVAVFI